MRHRHKREDIIISCTSHAAAVPLEQISSVIKILMYGSVLIFLACRVQTFKLSVAKVDFSEYLKCYDYGLLCFKGGCEYLCIRTLLSSSLHSVCLMTISDYN